MSERAARSNLDQLVINAELTLISITQGVALYFLVDSSADMVAGRQFQMWPYVLTGLLIIFLFWSRSLMHTLTIIQWPLEFIHNFLYVASTLLEAMMFQQISHTTNWFILTLITSLMIWLTFMIDMRMIHRAKASFQSTSGKQLIELLERDQLLNIRIIIPIIILLSGAVVILQLSFADYFILQGGYDIAVALQCILLFIYLMYTLRFYNRIGDMILTHRQEEWA